MLSNKNIIVTGANGTLGRSAVEVAQSYGANVVGFDLSFSESNTNQKKLDLLSLEAVKKEISNFERIDALLNIAGGFSMGSLTHDAQSDEWERMQATNVTTLRNMVAAIVPIMLKRKSGSIVNVGALSALRGLAQMSAYIASKNNVIRITESLSEEVKHNGVNVNVVLPSIIDTPVNRKAMPDADFSQWVEPESVAEIMCFLASKNAKAIHGALIPIAGLS